MKRCIKRSASVLSLVICLSFLCSCNGATEVKLPHEGEMVPAGSVQYLGVIDGPGSIITEPILPPFGLIKNCWLGQTADGPQHAPQNLWTKPGMFDDRQYGGS